MSTSLNAWTSFTNTPNLSAGLNNLEKIPERFKNIRDIQKTFAYCYFDSAKADEMFEQLTSNSDFSYSRYNFFHSNYLISKNKLKKAKEVINTSLKKNPRNLILNQLKLDLENKKII